MNSRFNNPWVWLLGAALLLLVASFLARGPREPPLPSGTIYYTGPLVGKGHTRPYEESEWAKRHGGASALPAAGTPATPGAAAASKNKTATGGSGE